MKRYRLPLLLLPPFAAIVLALALSLLAPQTGLAGGTPDVRPLFTPMAAPLKDSGLTIVTTGPVITSDLNTTFLILNLPGAATMRDARLSLDFWSNDVPSLHLPFTLTLEPGPNVFPVTWTTAALSPTYDARADNLLIAQWADTDGRAVDTALRSFNRFGADPLPSVALDASVWNIGTITRGAVLERAFTGGVESARNSEMAAARQVAYAHSVSIATSEVSMYMRASCAKYSSSGESATRSDVRR